MTRPHGRSLVARLTAVQVIVLGILWAVVIGLTIATSYQRGEGDIATELRASATSLARFTAAVPPATAQRIGDDLMAAQFEAADPPLRDGELAFRVWSADGTLLATSHEKPAMPAQSAQSARDPDWFMQSAWSRDHSRRALVGKRQDYYGRRVRSTSLQLAVMWLVLAALSAVAFWVAFRRVIRPLRELTTQVAARSNDDLSPVDDAAAFAELTPLLAAFNERQARIRAMLDGERRFFADAAHELRTPLAALGAQAHVLAHTTGEAERLQALRIIEGGIERSARVISRLLALGKLEGGDVRLDKRRHDVASIARGVLDVQHAEATRRGQRLSLNSAPPVPCDCDAEQLAVLIENLVDNAIRYGGDGGSIQVRVGENSGQILIRVSDDGPGIPPADRERAFARFERLGMDESTGSGLGLAIVRRIAELHGGTARIAAGPGGRGTAVEIRL